MSVFAIVLITVIATVAVALIAAVVYYAVNREQIDAEQARIQAALRAWNVAQQEYTTDQAVRYAARQAVDQMMREARNFGGRR